MNITIPQNDITEEQTDFVSPVSREGESEETTGGADVAYHKHCQKTVLAACGLNGRGATWNIIDGLSLNNLRQDWKTYFTGNNNMTEDLAGILKLLNENIGEGSQAEWTLKFTDNHNREIDSKTMNPWTDYDNNYVFSGFGRDVELSIDGQSLKFNTMKMLSGNQEETSIVFPRKTLTVTFNGSFVGEVSDINMPNNETIGISQDFNNLPNATVSSTNSIVRISGDTYVYKVVLNSSNADGTQFPTIQFDSSRYTSGNNTLQWEIHFINNTNEEITISELESNQVPTNYTPVALTDNFTVNANGTSIYMFKADMNTKVIAYYSIGGNKKQQEITIDDIYPVGSIYITLDKDFNPNQAFEDTTWDVVGQGRCLWGCDPTDGNDALNVEQDIEPGLPNITGRFGFNLDTDLGDSNDPMIEGAFYDGEVWNVTNKGLRGLSYVSDGDHDNFRCANFDASRSNQIYGNSDTVRPPALGVVFWRRTL